MSSRIKPRSMVAARIPVAPAMTEAKLQTAVIALARSLGWGETLSQRKAMVAEAAGYGVDAPALDGLVFHPRYSLGSEPGWPDLALIRRRDRRLIFAELKAEKGVLSPRQAEVLDLLRHLVNGPYDSEILGHVDLSRHPNVTTVEVHVWRPSDLASGHIAEVLR